MAYRKNYRCVAQTKKESETQRNFLQTLPMTVKKFVCFRKKIKTGRGLVTK